MVTSLYKIVKNIVNAIFRIAIKYNFLHVVQPNSLFNFSGDRMQRVQKAEVLLQGTRRLEEWGLYSVWVAQGHETKGNTMFSHGAFEEMNWKQNWPRNSEQT